MKVLILAAGYGTRLYAVNKDKPKPLLEVKGIPIIGYIMTRIEHIDDLNEVIVVTNEKFNQKFQDWAQKNQDAFPYPIRIINDGTRTPEERLGSIGDIYFVLREYAFQDDLLVVGGDNLFNFNIEDYIQSARQNNSSVSIGLYDIGNIKEATKFGVVSLDEGNKIIDFQEKPAEPKSTLVAMCFYYLPHTTFGLIDQYLKETQGADTAGDYIRWLHKKTDVYGFTFTGKWFDIGSVESYYQAEEQFSL